MSRAARSVPTAAVALVAALVLAPSTARAFTPPTSPFLFTIPDGWTDLSPGMPIPSEVPPAIAADARSKKFAVLAYDLRAGSRATTPDHLRVIVQRVESTPEQALARTAGAFSRPAGVYSSKVIEQGIVQLGALRAGRLVVEISDGPTTLRQLIYVVPARKKVAVMTWSTTPERFDSVRPVFEAASAALALEPGGRRFLIPLAVAALLIVGLVIAMGRAEKRKRA